MFHIQINLDVTLNDQQDMKLLSKLKILVLTKLNKYKEDETQNSRITNNRHKSKF